MIDPILIERQGLYDDGALRQALGLTPSTLSAARQNGGLRYVRKGKRTLYRGDWILDWIESESKIAPRDQAQGREGRDA